jgi:hypothetical protein
MESGNTGRSPAAYISGIALSLLIAIWILWYWLMHSVGVEQAPRVDHLLFSSCSIGHSRLWDAFLGIYGMIFVFAATGDRWGEPGGMPEDIVALCLGAGLGFLLTYICQGRGLTLASSGTLFIAAGIAFIAASLLVATDRARIGILLFLGFSFGLCLYVGVLAGFFLTLMFAFAYASAALFALRLQRALSRSSSY